MFLIGVVVVVVVIVLLAVRANRAKDRALQAAPTGSTRVEALKAVGVNGMVEKYARAGWTVVDQTTAKSVGSQAHVTITFRKG
jgi:hypothetical protein